MTQGIEETIKGILSDPRLTYPQRLTALAQAAENTPDPVPLSREARWFADKGIIFDMGGGQCALPPKVRAS